LPFMTDTFGLYYNTDMFDAAGLTEPPKTTDELVDYAKQLTQFNSDGSIKVAGFVPDTRYYCCALTAVNLAYMFNAKWLDDSGQAAFASDPQWAATKSSFISKSGSFFRTVSRPAAPGSALRMRRQSAAKSSSV